VNRIFILAAVALAASPAAADDAKSLRDRAVAASVRIANQVDGVNGSGVLVGQNGSEAYVLTAQHVVPKANRVKVSVSGGNSVEAEVLARSSEADLAIARFTAPRDLPTPLQIGGSEAPKSAISVGWSNGEAPEVLDEKLKGELRIRRPGETTSVLCWESERKPAPGRSGGPLIDQSGAVIGVATGHDGDVGYYVHSREIREFLRRNALKWLIENDR
jgi:S1-C subfamily serine protease